MNVREVAVGDRAEWAQMRHELWPDEDVTQLEAEANEFLANPAVWGVFVAEIDVRIVGFAECRIRESATGCATSGVGYLEAWYVEPAARRRGVARALLSCCEDWARARGASEMASDTTDEYPLSPAAHRSVGFTEVRRHYCYRKSL